MIVTIDGPAGTGKTTVAKRVAERLGFAFFDTGALYRSVTYQIMQKKIDLSDQSALETLLEAFQFEVRAQQYYVDGEDVTAAIRTPEVTGRVSEVSANPRVRSSLLRVQRDFGAQGDSVFEGRDMGTVVFPEADVKVFLTARPAVRAERRYTELKENHAVTTEQEVLEKLLERDHFDSTREIAPLKQAADAHLVDTSDLTLDQVIDRVIALIPS